MRWFQIALVCLAVPVFAQTPSPSPSFEAVAIRPAAPSADGRIMIGIQGGPGTPNPGQMNFWNISIGDLIQNAYNVRNFQISGPDWLWSERFDITAKVPAGATKEQGRVMMRNMLAQRFSLVLHRTTKEASTYALVAAKGGPKLGSEALKKSGTGPTAAPPKRMMMIGGNGLLKMDLKGATMDALVDTLGTQVDRPIVDATGLTGSYDVAMEFAPDPAVMAMKMGGIGQAPPSPTVSAPGLNDAPTIFTALQDQLGLKLESRKGPVEHVIVDSVQKTPTEN
ncbi:MAG TPA: TIGR03435 family protein [Bryobacteraceae bacterium]|nr:TIGR03435 family protein [Bryobacteraceae bacterium]